MWGSCAVRHLSPHWGTEDPSGVQSSLCVSIYVSLSVSLSIYIFFWFYASSFGNHKSAARNCAQHMHTQAYSLCNFCILLFSSVGVQCRDAFSPHWGLKDPNGIYSSLCVSVLSPYVCLFLCLDFRINFWQSKQAVFNFAQRMRPQAMR